MGDQDKKNKNENQNQNMDNGGTDDEMLQETDIYTTGEYTTPVGSDVGMRPGETADSTTDVPGNVAEFPESDMSETLDEENKDKGKKS